jgi:hypothetical protein
MRKRLIAAIATLTVAVAVGTPMLTAATGKTKHTCSFDLAALSAVVKVNSGNPPANGSDTAAATLDGKLCGTPFHGAARDLNHFPTLGTFDGKIINFVPQGSIKAKFQGTATVNPDHSDSLHGHGTITGGTGVYQSATGSLSFTGTKPENSNVTSQHITGTLNY